jgi:hypothetical protein
MRTADQLVTISTMPRLQTRAQFGQVGHEEVCAD